jgi:hypothetical protein
MPLKLESQDYDAQLTYLEKRIRLLQKRPFDLVASLEIMLLLSLAESVKRARESV